jgi:hypothetical protein
MWQSLIPMGLGLIQSMRGANNMQDPTAQYVDPRQQQFQQYQRQQFMDGQGDYGFARDFRLGNDTLAQTLAGRGMSMNSGVGVSGMANVLGQASGNASSRRMQAGNQIAGMSPASYMSQPNNAAAQNQMSMGNMGTLLAANSSGLFDGMFS